MVAVSKDYQSDLTHGPLNKTDTYRLFGGGSTGHTRSLVSRFSKEILPGVHSFSTQALIFQDDYYDRLTELLPKTDDPETGLTTNGIYASFDKGKCPSGYMSNPMGYIPVSNKLLRTQLGLTNDMPPAFLSIVRELSSHLHSHWVECDINVTPGSSAGFVGFRREADWKIACAERIFQPKEMEKYLRLIWEDKDVEFANWFETVFAFYTQKRDQIDSIGKQRIARGLDYARDPEGNPDDWQYADKKVVIGGVHYPHHSATRARMVHAAPWAINSAIAPVSAGAMRFMFLTYPNVWHVNTPDHIESLINGNYVWHGDASEFDQSHPEKGMDAYHDGVRDHWNEKVVKIAEKLLYSPYYAKPLSLDGKPAWIGTPMGAGRQVVCGNRSGHAWTSIYNKIMMVAAILYALHQAGYTVVGNVIHWLKGEGVIKFINNGDDTIIYSKDKVALKRVTDLLVETKSAIYKLEKEKGGVYSGMPCILTDSKTLTYKCVPNGANGVYKILSPERPIYNPKSQSELKADLASGRKIFRMYWFIGFGQKIAQASLDPTTEVIMNTFLEMWSTHMRDFMTIPQMLDMARAKVPPLGAELSLADSEVLEDPRKLHYKWMPEEVSQAILDKVTSKVPYSVFEGFVSSYFTGTIIPRDQYTRTLH